MSLDASPPLTVALIGNPNTGKSTIFNALAGVRQRVANYPGVTVEKKEGRLKHEGRAITLIDLPGTYSLAPRSPDEMVAVDVLLGRRADTPRPQAVLCILDASNLERNLYLLSQVLELELPTVVALNMLDVAEQKQITVDVAELSRRLRVPVIPLQAHRKVGVAELKHALATLKAEHAVVTPSPFPAEFQQEVATLQAKLRAALGSAPASAESAPWPRYLVERLLLDTSGYLQSQLPPEIAADTQAALADARQRLEKAGAPVPGVEAIARYAWAGQALAGVTRRAPRSSQTSWTDRLDRVLTHKFWGTLVFVTLMALMFQAVFTGAQPFIDGMEWGVSQLGDLVGGWLAEGPLRALLVEGVIAGVGGVLVFLPQIFILFFFIAVLEDCGYMARAAYLMDKLMSQIGLSGKSFIPLLSSFACAIPGVMAARVIENRRDRLLTILVAPLMSCSARLPVYTLLIGAFIPRYRFFGVPWGDGWLWEFGLQGLTMLAMYSVGVVAAVLVAWTLRRTLLRGATPPFVMELPGYKWPSPGLVLHRVLDRGWAFVRRAGTLILAVSVVTWAAMYYPRSEPALRAAAAPRVQRLESELAALPEASPRRAALHEELARVENEIQSGQRANSLLGRAGQWIEPAVRPLGWDWRIGCAAIVSFPAREVVISALGVIYSVGGDVDEKSPALSDRLRDVTWDGADTKVFGIPTALSLMVFFALCAQCASTLVVIRRETNSWRWPAFTFVYMTALAYVAALATYQIGSRL